MGEGWILVAALNEESALDLPQDTELRQRGDAVVQSIFFHNLAVRGLEDRDPGEVFKPQSIY